MRVNGRWLLCDDGITRPIIDPEVMGIGGIWIATEFLLDSGADRTVFAERTLTELGLSHLPTEYQLGGVGGAAKTVAVNTEIRFSLEGGGSMTIEGTFAAFSDREALEMSVLGRNITNLFAVIIDRPKDVICMIGEPHGYTITQG